PARPPGAPDLAPLEEAADVLPNLHLFDLEDTAHYPERHAEAFGLPAPLAPDAFHSAAEVELLAPPGGRLPPPRLGRFGLPVRSGGPEQSAGTAGAVDNHATLSRGSATLPVRGPTSGANRGLEREHERGAVRELPPRYPWIERVLLDLGRRVVEVTRLPGPTLCGLALTATLVVFVATFVGATWAAK